MKRTGRVTSKKQNLLLTVPGGVTARRCQPGQVALKALEDDHLGLLVSVVRALKAYTGKFQAFNTVLFTLPCCGLVLRT